MSEDGQPQPDQGNADEAVPTRRPSPSTETRAAARSWWDREADDYYLEHGRFLGDADLVWGPEGLRESAVGLLGDLTGLHVLEVGCGGAQGSRWALAQGAATAVGLDLSAGMLATARRIDARAETVAGTRPRPALVQADAARLPFRDGVFDVAFSAYGAVPFTADSAAIMCEVARVLRPGGRWAFSVTHPVRWCFPDDPGPAGLRVGFSYFDRDPYVEEDPHGRATYVEHHRTLGDRVRELVSAGLDLVDLVEPEWPPGHDEVWGGWSPLRGALVPGTAIFVTRRRG